MDITTGQVLLKIMIKFIISGPESSGKTTLANHLSKIYNSNLINEYSRDFLNKNKNKYSYEDLLKIAKIQFHQEKLLSKKEICICDTDLITIKIWSEFKYKKCDIWIKDMINRQSTEKRIYLVCKPDIKWEYDPQRENEHNRDEIFEIFKREIKKLKHDFFIIEGEKRLEKAVKFIEKIII